MATSSGMINPMPLSPLVGDAVATLTPREVLFHSGERKLAAYRVESGVVCVYDPRNAAGVVEFLFPGDYIGLGFLDTHALSARALLVAKVRRIPLGAIDEIVAASTAARARRSQEDERDFAVRREQLVGESRAKPVERLASVLVNLSCSNAYECRDPTLITDRMDSEMWSDMLGLDIAELTGLLLELQRRGLVEPALPAGLRIKDIDALEALADGPPRPLPEPALPAPVIANIDTPPAPAAVFGKRRRRFSMAA